MRRHHRVKMMSSLQRLHQQDSFGLPARDDLAISSNRTLVTHSAGKLENGGSAGHMQSQLMALASKVVQKELF